MIRKAMARQNSRLVTSFWMRGKQSAVFTRPGRTSLKTALNTKQQRGDSTKQHYFYHMIDQTLTVYNKGFQLAFINLRQLRQNSFSPEREEFNVTYIYDTVETRPSLVVDRPSRQQVKIKLFGDFLPYCFSQISAHVVTGFFGEFFCEFRYLS